MDIEIDNISQLSHEIVKKPTDISLTHSLIDEDNKDGVDNSVRLVNLNKMEHIEKLVSSESDNRLILLLKIKPKYIALIFFTLFIILFKALITTIMIEIYIFRASIANKSKNWMIDHQKVIMSSYIARRTENKKTSGSNYTNDEHRDRLLSGFDLIMLTNNLGVRSNIELDCSSFNGIFEDQQVSIICKRTNCLNAINASTSLKQELNSLKNLISNEKLTKFIGLYCQPFKLMLLFESFERGTLYEILRTEKSILDPLMLSPLIGDIIKGMEYLHASSIGYHGFLTSKNCLIDGNWNLRLTGYGLKSIDVFSADLDSFKNHISFLHSKSQYYHKYGRLEFLHMQQLKKQQKCACQEYLWTAPEKLRAIFHEVISERRDFPSINEKLYKMIKHFRFNKTKSFENDVLLRQMKRKCSEGERIVGKVSNLSSLTNPIVIDLSKNSKDNIQPCNSKLEKDDKNHENIVFDTKKASRKKSISCNLENMSLPFDCENTDANKTQTLDNRKLSYNDMVLISQYMPHMSAEVERIERKDFSNKQREQERALGSKLLKEERLLPYFPKYQYSLGARDSEFLDRRKKSVIKFPETSHTENYQNLNNTEKCNDGSTNLENLKYFVKINSTGYRTINEHFLDDASSNVFDFNDLNHLNKTVDDFKKLSHGENDQSIEISEKEKKKGKDTKNLTNQLEFIQKADIYSFGIIVFECVAKLETWFNNPKLTACKIIKSSFEDGNDQTSRTSKIKMLKPKIKDIVDGMELYVEMISSCIKSDPNKRPNFVQIRSIHDSILAYNGINGNIYDSLINIMNIFSCEIENLLMETNIDLMLQKIRAENFLKRIFPQQIISQLIRSSQVTPEHYEQVTVLFSDIAGFTELCSKLSPQIVTTFLDKMYGGFDRIISDNNAYKVETIGDGYMAVAGVPIRSRSRHAIEMSVIALKILKKFQQIKQEFCTTIIPDLFKCNIRIGLHTGPVIAGVVGNKMPRYCLFGKTVVIANLMEEKSSPNKILISETTRAIIAAEDLFQISFNCSYRLTRSNQTVMTYFLNDFSVKRRTIKDSSKLWAPKMSGTQKNSTIGLSQSRRRAVDHDYLLGDDGQDNYSIVDGYHQKNYTKKGFKELDYYHDNRLSRINSSSGKNYESRLRDGDKNPKLKSIISSIFGNDQKPKYNHRFSKTFNQEIQNFRNSCRLPNNDSSGDADINEHLINRSSGYFQRPSNSREKKSKAISLVRNDLNFYEMIAQYSYDPDIDDEPINDIHNHSDSKEE